MNRCHSGTTLQHLIHVKANYQFRQRRFFYYMTGCNLPDAYFTYDIATDKSTLFIPPINDESVIWSGLPLSPAEALKLYDVDIAQTTNEVAASLARPAPKSTVWAIANQVSDHITFVEFEDKDFTLLKEAIEECRAVKDEYEIALTKKANAISTIAHTAVLKAVKTATNERELEGLFIEKSIANGAREQAYHSIVASGTAAATLHYVNNHEPLAGKLNLLLDAGAEYNCYASDIVSGPWSHLCFRHSLECQSFAVQLYGPANQYTDPNLPHIWEIQHGKQGDL
jgi:Xaa-Pro dipeptidase